MLLFKAGMDTDSYPPSSAPKLPRLGGQFRPAGENVKTTSNQFNRTTFADILLDLTVATVCCRTTDVRSHG